jgi:four helix bundle protein
MIKTPNKKQYDLEERTAKFGEEVIKLSCNLRENAVVRPIISQLIRSSTSIGANYSEADDAESKKDFKHKIGICKKESRETKHWLRMLAIAEPKVQDQTRKLWVEAKELNLIFNAINNKLK